MADQKYTYSLANDFPNGLDAARLKTEINDSSILHSLGDKQIYVSGDVVEIWFSDTLSAGDKTSLDGDTTNPAGGLLGAHSGLPLESINPVHLVSADGSDVPETADKRPIFTTARFGQGIDPYICGSGDKVDDPVAKGMGPKFQIGWTSAPPDEPSKTQEIDFQFLDTVRVAAGGMVWTGGELGDTIDMWMSAPASVVAANGGGTGNANKVNLGGPLNIIVPAAGDGAWDVDLAPSLHAESPVPVPNLDGVGQWDWAEPDEGLGTFTPNPGAGKYDFYDFENKLVHWVCNVPILGSGNIYIDPNSIDRRIFPQWKWYTSAYNVGHSDLAVAFYLNLARKKTT